MQQTKLRFKNIRYKSIPGFPGYFASRSGKIFSQKTRTVLAPQINIKGYLRVAMWANNKRTWMFIHRLVAFTYIPNPQDKPEVNHLDWDRWNNKRINLEWCTPRENQLHNRKRWGASVATMEEAGTPF